MNKSKELILAIQNGGLNDDYQKKLLKYFKPFLDQAKEWEAKAMDLVITDVEQTDDMAKAREGRLFLKKIRTEANKKRAELKEASLNEGRAIQAVYKVIEDAIKPIESHLLEQEQFAERLETETKNKLRQTRNEFLEQYKEFHLFSSFDIAEILEDDFQKLLTNYKAQKEAKELKEKQEAERLLKAEEEKRKKLEEDRKEMKRKMAEERKKRLAAEKKAMDEKSKLDKKIKAEQEAKKQLEDKIRKSEAKAKKEFEAKAKIEAKKKAEEEKRKAAPDKAKLLYLAQVLDDFNDWPELETDRAKEILLETKELYNAVIGLLHEKAKEL